HLSGLHGLVIVDRHLSDVAGDAWCNDDRIGPDIGVIGFHLKSPNLPVVRAVARSDRQTDHSRHAKQRLFEGQAAASNPGGPGINARCPLNHPTHGSLLAMAAMLPFRGLVRALSAWH